MKRLRMWFVPLVATVALVAAGCASSGSVGTGKGDVAPDFSLPSLDGSSKSLSDFRGKTVVLNFFASWCGPCRAEMPDMQTVYGDLAGQDSVVIGVNQAESKEQVQSFASDLGLTFPILLDTQQEVARTYGVRGYPTTYIIDAQGVIRDVIVGGPLTRTAIQRLVQGAME